MESCSTCPNGSNNTTSNGIVTGVDAWLKATEPKKDNGGQFVPKDT